jgi:hypothetical protein
MLLAGPPYRVHLDEPSNPQRGMTACTRREATGTTRPACTLCWLVTETRLARDEQLRLADDGGRMP